MVLVVIWLRQLAIQHVQSARFNPELAAERGPVVDRVMVGQPFADAIQFAAARTQPGDYVLSLPQGPSSISFPALSAQGGDYRPRFSHARWEKRMQFAALPNAA